MKFVGNKMLELWQGLVSAAQSKGSKTEIIVV